MWTMSCTYSKIRIQSSTRHTKGGKRSGLLGRVLKPHVASQNLVAPPVQAAVNSSGGVRVQKETEQFKRDNGNILSDAV
jgi:hypothetical protein